MGIFYRDPGSRLTKEQLETTAWGSLYAMQQKASLDTFSTGLGELKMKRKILRANKKIRCRTDALLWLNGALYRIENALEHPEKYQVFLSQKQRNLFKKYEFISKKEELSTFSTIGWDIGRVVFLSRVMADTGYVSEEEAWKFIRKAAGYATVYGFKHWDAFTKSYLLGRIVSGHYRGHFIPVFLNYSKQLQSPDNLWGQIIL